MKWITTIAMCVLALHASAQALPYQNPSAAHSGDGSGVHTGVHAQSPQCALDSIRYNLCRIDFDPATGQFGDQIETVIDAAHNPLPMGEGMGWGIPSLSPVPPTTDDSCAIRSLTTDSSASGTMRPTSGCST